MNQVGDEIMNLQSLACDSNDRSEKKGLSRAINIDKEHSTKPNLVTSVTATTARRGSPEPRKVSKDSQSS